jgi:brefeldin A-resistance guanine nucleotide exchange factor 1
MSSGGYLVPKSQDVAQETLWIETWKRLDRFLPDLRKELDLEGIKGKVELDEGSDRADASSTRELNEDSGSN